MSTPAQQPPERMTLAQFNAWNERQEGRHEFLNGQVVAMSTATRRHARVLGRLRDVVKAALGDDCDLYVNEIGVVAGEDRPEPDLVVTCDERDRGNDDLNFVSFPKLVVEVVSPSTGGYDLGYKVWLYCSIPTVQDYLVVHPQDHFAVLFQRRTKGFLTMEFFFSTVTLASVGLTLDLDSVWDR
jgi:Uma2 family endonuclease